MEPISAVGTATTILSNSLKALKAVRERAQSWKDNDMKAHISSLYDSLLELKEALSLLTDENRGLRLKISELEKQPDLKPTLRQVGSANFYYLADQGPYCQACFDGQGKLTMLTPTQPWSGGIRRHCLLCKQFFYEKP